MDFALLKKAFSHCWQKPFCVAVYWLAARLTRQDKLILCSSTEGDKFGNIAVLAQKLREWGIDFIYLSNKQAQKNPLSFFKTIASARVIVIDAASPATHVPLSHRTTVVQCWHAGGAYKKVAFDTKRDTHNSLFEEMRVYFLHGNISYFVCSSPKVCQIYAKAFHLKQEQLLPFGVPRLDKIINDKKVPPQRYVVLYAPTFRGNVTRKRRIPSLPNVDKLKKALQEYYDEEVVFAFRKHPTITSFSLPKGWEDWSNMPSETALHLASVLITDYSSIFFDFLPFKRPVIFYTPDFESYLTNERNLYFSPYEAFPDVACSDEQSLIDCLIRFHRKKITHHTLWDHYMSSCDGQSTERTCTFLKNLMID